MIALASVSVATGIVSGKGASFGFNIDDIFRVVDPESYRSLSWSALPQLIIKTTGTALFVWVYLATSVKRLHDRDKSAWWMIPFFVIPGLFNQFSDRLPDDSYAIMGLGLIAFVLCTWGFIELLFLKGSRKTNRFGANPLEPPPSRDTRPRWDQQSEIETVPHKAGPPPVWRVNRGA
jgi:uncharacterized membrane protein YhaH (DUF805 family)